jgi:hypothetical protein
VPCASGPTLNGRLRTSAKAREPAGPSGSVKGLSARPGRHGPDSDSESELPSAGDPRRPRPVCTPGKAGWARHLVPPLPGPLPPLAARRPVRRGRGESSLRGSLSEGAGPRHWHVLLRVSLAGRPAGPG